MSNSNINEPPAEENRISISWGRRDINELQPPPSRAQIIAQCTSLATDDDDDDDAKIKAVIKNTNQRVANTTDADDSVAATSTNTNNHPTTIVATCDAVDDIADVESQDQAVGVGNRRASNASSRRASNASSTGACSSSSQGIGGRFAAVVRARLSGSGNNRALHELASMMDDGSTRCC